MKYSFAVLLLQLLDQNDTPFDLAYAQQVFTAAGRGTRNLVDYFLDVSHGHADLSDSAVFDWLRVGYTADDLAVYTQQTKDDEIKRLNDENATLPATQQRSAEKIEQVAAEVAHNARRAKIKAWVYETAAAAHIKLDTFFGFIAVFSAPIDYFGSYKEVVLQYNPDNPERNSIDLTGVAHEVGHGLGLTHSRREDSNTDYGDPWDIMSAYSVRYNRAGIDAEDPHRPYHTYGPGLNVVNMAIPGWLDSSRVFSAPMTGAWQVTLRPLHRLDLPGFLAARVGNYWLEFRMNEGWDSAIRRPVVLLHERTIDEHGQPCSQLIVTQPGRLDSRPDMRDGDSFELGSELDLDGDFLRLSVSIDAEARVAHIYGLHRRRRSLEPALPLEGVTTDGGGLVYIPGRGWVRIPPRSPLHTILVQIAEVEQLQALSAVPAQQAAINALVTERLSMLHADLGRMIAGRRAVHVPGEQFEREQDG